MSSLFDESNESPMGASFGADSDQYLNPRLGREENVIDILIIQGTVEGAVVKGVSDVTTLNAQVIKPAPQFESALEPCFIEGGLATLGERMLIVMRGQALMSNSQMGMVAAPL